jgi:hypothetical protein
MEFLGSMCRNNNHIFSLSLPKIILLSILQFAKICPPPPPRFLA